MAKWVKKWDVASGSDPNKSYVVSQDEDGNFGCSCPAWTMARRECKHIKVVKMGHVAAGGTMVDINGTVFPPEADPIADVMNEKIEQHQKSPKPSKDNYVPLLERLKNEAPWRFA